jgi:hypothetical protein
MLRLYLCILLDRVSIPRKWDFVSCLLGLNPIYILQHEADF